VLAYRIALSLVLLGSAIVPGGAQSGRRPGQSNGATDGEDVVKLKTLEVILSVTVRDAMGRPVPHLGVEDFIIVEDGQRQKIESFSVAQMPVNVVLVLDASGSVFSELRSIRRAAVRFVDALPDNSMVSVIQFADKVELLQDWTSNRDDVRLALRWRYRGGDRTAMWDALYLAADEQLRRVEGRRAIILLTDGLDTWSRTSSQHVIAALDRSGTSLWVVSKAQALCQLIRPYAGVTGKITGTARNAQASIDRLNAAEDRLRELADRYGGRLYSPLTEADLENAYSDLATELSQQYVITYAPTNEVRDRRWRAIDVYLTRPGLQARTRKGYVVVE
jgi:VWFA-related protein